MKRRQESTAAGIELPRVVDALPGLVWTAFSDGGFDFFNQRWCDYTGLTLEQASGDGWRSAVHPDDLAALLATWQSCLDTGKPADSEARMRRQDGVYRWFQFRASPLTDDSGRVSKWCGISIDIEDRRRAEAAVRAHEQTFRQIVDGLPALVAILGPDGEILHFNRKTLEYAGVPLAESSNWTSRVHPDDRPAAVAGLRASIATGEPFEAEWRHRRADGVYRWFHTRGFPLRDDEGRILLWYFLLNDVEERKRAEALLAGEKHLLEMVALGLPLHSVLDRVCHLAEEIDSGCQSCILLIDPSSNKFQRGGACCRTSGYVQALEGLYITEGGGACGMAALSRSQVIVEDVASDPRWSSRWRDLSLAHGVCACWSTPILSREDEVLGTFLICRTEPGTPTPFQCELIGRLTHIASIAIERMLNDMTVKRTLEGFRAIVETTPDCVTLVARDGTLLQINAVGAGKLGALSAEAVKGACVYDFIAPEHRQRYIDFQQEVCAGKRGFLEYDLFTLQGECCHMETHAAPFEHMGGTVVQLGVTRDITARKQAEDDLRRREALMARVQQLSSSGSFCWHLHNGEVHWSEELYRMFQIESGTRITLELIAEHLHPDDLPLLQDMIERAQAGLDFEYEHRLLMPDGSVKCLYTQAYATLDQRGRVEYIGAAQDVTQRHRAEEALAGLRAELAHVSRVNSLGAVTASIAHEINQPLAGIMTNAGTGLRMLGADPPNVEGALETVRRTLRDGRRASEVVTRLRALYSKKVVMSDSVCLSESADEVVELLRGELRRNQIVLRHERATDLPRVTGDRVQLQQVVLNLLLNAIEAMHCVEDRARQLLIRTERDGSTGVRLTVTDSGPGFDPQHAGQLFDAFYTTKTGGMGIGLSVSRSIVESHGGRLWATSNEEPGATFAFSIPCQSASAVAADHLGAAPRPAVAAAPQTGWP